MKILGKLTILFLVLLATSAVTFIVLKDNMARSLILLVEKEKNDTESTFDKILELRGSALKNFADDYTFWDDMVNFVTTGDPTWAQQNIEESMTSTYKNDAAWVYKLDWTLTYSVNRVESEGLRRLPITDEKIKSLFLKDYFCHFFMYTDKGLMEIRGATVQPTDDPERKTPPRGYFFVGRLWTEEYLAEFSSLIGGVINIADLGTKDMSPGPLPRDETGVIRFSRILPDWEGKPLASMNVKIISRTIMEAKNGFDRIFPPFFILQISSFLLILALILFWVYRPVAVITSVLKNGDTFPISELKKTKGEFGNMARLVSNFFEQKTQLDKEAAEHKRMARELKTAADEWERTFNSINDMVFIQDKDSNIIRANKFCTDILKMDPEQVVGKKCYEILHNLDHPWPNCPFVKVMQNRVSYAEEVYDPHIGIPLLVTVSPIFSEDGELIGAVHIGKDISEAKKNEATVKKYQENLEEQAVVLDNALKDSLKSRDILSSMLEDNNQIREKMERNIEELKIAYSKIRETQGQLIQAEKLSAVGQLASGVAHEVKNPLGIILQSINYLEGKISAEQKESHEILQMAKNNIKRADSIIRSLVDFSRASNLTLAPENINSILESALGLIQHRVKLESVNVIKELKNDLPMVYVDKIKMEQVFVNIFLNAIQAMSNGGMLVVRSYLVEMNIAINGVGRRQEDNFKIGESAIAVEVEDTGIGIPAENIAKVFDPFFTTKGPREGAGLGLSVTRNIIDMHKGLISIESKQGMGTKVTITLKISKDAG